MNRTALRCHVLENAAIAAVLLFASANTWSQEATSQPASAATQPAPAIATTQPAPQTEPSEKPLSLEPILVNAEKRRQAVQDVPQSISVITAQALRDGGVSEILDASMYAPNVNIAHFNNRRLSFPYFRGVGSGENAPAVTTNYDGVPQLSFRTTNLEFLDIHDIEFIRGPQGTLYGRNSMGGVINIYSNPPTNKFSFDSSTTVGNYNYFDERAAANFPIVTDHLALRIAGGYSTRDGYTKNDLTGHDVDSKEASFGKLQLWFAPNDQFDMTLRLNAERDRDGDYPLGDLAAIRSRPWHVSHGFEGNSLRDVGAASLTMNYYTEYATFTSISGYTYWRSQDLTGLDYTPYDLIRRQNRENENDFSQEFLLASPKDRPLALNDNVKLAWLVGAFGFVSDYGQDAVNNLSPALQQPVSQVGSLAAINQRGIGIFGQATLTLYDKLDLIAGARFDAERDHAVLGSFTEYGPNPSLIPSKTFNNYSTQWGLAYHWTPDLMTYATAAQGYKAGGFNASPLAPQFSYAPDSNWTYEAGVKSTWFKNRLALNACYFYTDWRNMQLDNLLPDGSAYINNAGKTHSQGVEFEANARPTDNLELFAGVAYLQSQFDTTIPALGINHGNDLPFAPNIDWNVGGEYSMKLCKSAQAYLRVEEFGSGRYFYDATNLASQGAYAMTNFRLGIRGRHWNVEGWVENAFEAHTVPLAIPYDRSFAPSGYVGESGIPRLYGVTLRVDF
ncbi:MAG: TonB-dependent receptor [Phycisphaerales bacterium]|nr:TonB-dependent receptor [Phycisphaerales bacterium]